MKRSRGRNRRSGGNPQNAFNNPNRHFESVGPDVKIRGSAQQVLEKYLQYARDAQTSGDRILSEAYFQFAEHYQRIVAKQLEARSQQQPQQNRGDRRDDQGGRGYGDRDNRGGPSGEGADAGEDEAGEAVVVSAHMPRESDETDGADSLRVIDADDRDEAEASVEAAEKTGEDSPRAERNPAGRTRRKPYKAREERSARPTDEPEADATAATEGVMKTLSRGRRRPAVEEDAEAEATD
ncbi:MAG: DUF4167 domain-containing protein [Hyphomonas sp.]